jgi:hypothetical protein
LRFASSGSATENPLSNQNTASCGLTAASALLWTAEWLFQTAVVRDTPPSSAFIPKVMLTGGSGRRKKTAAVQFAHNARNDAGNKQQQ